MNMLSFAFGVGCTLLAFALVAALYPDNNDNDEQGNE